MELSGNCIHVGDLEEGVGQKGAWKKLSFVIEFGDEYIKKAAFTLLNDKVNMTPRVGDYLKVRFGINSREYNNRWYTELNCFGLEGYTGNLGQAKSAVPTSTPAPQTEAGGSATDDLPF